MASGDVPGILAYQGSEPVGWCAIAPRSATPRLNSSRVAAPVEEVGPEDWAITYFYVATSCRRTGVMDALIGAALQHTRRAGARRVEACPVDPRRKLMWGEGFVGIASVFRGAGFAEVARRSETRPLVRYEF